MSNQLNRVAIAGVGYSQTGRQLDLSDDALVRQAVMAAMADAGMTTADIDGVATMGGSALHIGFTMGIDPLSFFFTSSGSIASILLRPTISGLSDSPWPYPASSPRIVL